jgi:hypothetical protein
VDALKNSGASLDNVHKPLFPNLTGHRLIKEGHNFCRNPLTDLLIQRIHIVEMAKH